ncbi:MAG: hypothetical protein JWP49_377 [Phenylobacterium sp.]|jgi:hypothetical protein|nr:hypothetical protein [Phenylobacterium sp.]
MGLLNWFASLAPSAAEIRAEVWSLGVRHRGHALDGALQELAGRSVPPARAALLKACVQQLRRR